MAAYKLSFPHIREGMLREGGNPNTWMPTEVYPHEGGGGHDID